MSNDQCKHCGSNGDTMVICKECMDVSMELAAPENSVQQWQSVEDFQKEANEGHCWIVYKGRVTLAWHNYEQIFRFSRTGAGCYMTECISSVMVLNPPEKPSKL